jgi:hypothetical protein
MSKSAWKNRREDGKTARRRYKGRISGPFVALLKDTLRTPAWKALSFGARSLYVVLKWRYNLNLMNGVYVTTRVAADELGSGRNTVQPWFHELEHYGFIVMISPAHHAVGGHGKAPHWRLTDVPYDGKEPTRDFLCWDGTPFTGRKKRRRLHTLKKQKPRPDAGVNLTPTPMSTSDKKFMGNGTVDTHAGVMSAHRRDTHAGVISSLTTCHDSDGSTDAAEAAPDQKEGAAR